MLIIAGALIGVAVGLAVFAVLLIAAAVADLVDMFRGRRG